MSDRACQQGGMQHLPVVIARVFIRGEIAADAKFFQHNRPAYMGKLAVEGGAEMLARDIVIRGIGMGADKIDGARNLTQTKAVVAPRRLEAPRSIAGRYWLRGPGGAYRLHQQLRPAASHLRRRLPPIDRHLVGEQPARDSWMIFESADRFSDVNRLLRQHPAV